MFPDIKGRAIDTLVWLGIAVCACFLSVALAYPALAQDITTGRGPICDTQDQIKRVAALEGDTQAVNNEIGSESACGIVLVAFHVGASHGQVRTPHGTFAITEITVVAAHLGMGWQSVRPFVQYTLMKVTEEPA